MKTMILILNRAALLFCALFASAVFRPSASAAIAERITYQGNLRESGLLVTGIRSMTFRLYDAPAAGTLLWASGATTVTVSTGVFRAVLTPSGLNWESALWLEVEAAGTVLSPREELTAAPFAANALYHSGKKYTNAAAAPASPGVGDLWFDTGTSALKFWSGSAWTSTAGSGAAHAATHAGAGADQITGLGAHTLTGNITMSPGTSLAAGAGSPGVSVSTHLVVSGSINPASNLAAGGPGFSVAFASVVTAGWFYGNGAGLTGITAVPPANMATTDTTQTITGAKTFSAGLTASSGTFTAAGPGQFSLQTSSGISVLGTGGVTAAFFSGSGAALTGIAAAPPANMATTDTTQTITGAKTFSAALAVAGDFQVGDASASTISASGYLTLASLGSAPPGAPGRVYYDSASSKLRLNIGTGFVDIATGTTGGGADATRVAKAGDMMTGALTMSGAAANIVSGSSITTSGGFFGSGDGITTLNAANLSAGTVPLARLTGITNAEIAAAAGITDSKLATIATAGKVSDSALSSNVALLTGAQSFTGAKTFNNVALNLSGASGSLVGQSSITTSGGFFGNGAGVVGVTAANIAAGLAGISVTGNAATATNATNHIADVTGAVHGASSLNTANMIVRRDASGNFSVSDPINNTDAANKQWVLANAGRVQYMGLAPASTGAMGGPLGANAKCAAVYPGSYLCRQSDILVAGVTAIGGAWVNAEFISYDGANYVAHGVTRFVALTNTDPQCAGWSIGTSAYRGMTITTSGDITYSFCNASIPLACCH